MPEHATPPDPLTAALCGTGASRGPGAAYAPGAAHGTAAVRNAAAAYSAGAPRNAGAPRSTRAFSGTGAAPCAWPVTSAATSTPRSGPTPAAAWTLTGVGSRRSRAFVECPGSQIAAQARAMAATASAEALAELSPPTPLTVVDQPTPSGTLPLGDHRGPGRFCLGMFPGQREQVGQARAFLAAFLGGWARADDAVLLIGELGANAVVHTGSGAPGGLFTVRAMLSGAWLRAEVEDQGSSWNGRLEEAECPHGLFLLRQLAARCGTRRARGGWVTWFALGDDAIGPAREPQSGRSGINPVHSPASGCP